MARDDEVLVLGVTTTGRKNVASRTLGIKGRNLFSGRVGRSPFASGGSRLGSVSKDRGSS